LERPGGNGAEECLYQKTCNGHAVKAEVSVAKNYAGVPESNTDNNKTDEQVCPAAGSSAPLGSSGAEIDTKPPGLDIESTQKPAAEIDTNRPGLDPNLPDYLRPGTHELELAPTALRSLSRITRGGVQRGPVDDTTDPDAMRVGWDKHDPLYDFKVWQTAVNFDLSKLLEVGNPFIAEAHLSFLEREDTWIGGDGRRWDIPGCVSVLGIATNNWGVPPQQFVSPDFLFRQRYLTDVFIPQTTTMGEPGSIERWRAFDMTGHVRSQMVNRDDPDLWFGYVMRGAVEDDDGTDTSCMSRIPDIPGIRLWVTYVVGSH
jgi:hypothetical protein